MEQQVVGAVVWTACSPNLEDLGQANVVVPLGVDSLPLLGWGRGQMNEFGEDRGYLFGSAFRSLVFHRWVLT